MESINLFCNNIFPSSSEETSKRREKFSNYIKNILPIDIPIKYNFVKVNGDGNCLFHSIIRYFGYLNIDGLPNKDLVDMNTEEKILYNNILNNLKKITTEYIREFTGDDTFVLDKNCPEYQLICKFISDKFDLRIIILEYDAYNNNSFNKVSTYLSETQLETFSDTLFLINFSCHFTLIFPTSTEPKFDTKTIRNIAGNELIKKASINNLLF